MHGRQAHYYGVLSPAQELSLEFVLLIGYDNL